MAEVTEARIAEAVAEIKAELTDGEFDFEDIQVLAKHAYLFAEIVGLSGDEKLALALKVAEQVLAETEIPYLPDQLKLPFLGEVGADALILRALPKLWAWRASWDKEAAE